MGVSGHRFEQHIFVDLYCAAAVPKISIRLSNPAGL
jgi:hypothetical protein